MGMNDHLRALIQALRDMYADPKYGPWLRVVTFASAICWIIAVILLAIGYRG